MDLKDIDFLIIGATKSATTWLQQSLQRNPVISMPDPELHYFSRYYGNGDKWYLSHFCRNPHHSRVGEKSNSYLDTPHSAERIVKALPHVKLIAQLRNPVDRAYSDYCMLYRRGDVGKDIGQHLDPRYAKGKRFLNGGLYGQQLKSYFDLFSSSQILVMFFEEMKTDAPGQLRIVQNFLQLESTLPLSPVDKKVKDRNELLIGSGLKRYLAPLKPLVAPFRQSRSFNYFRGLIAHEVEYVPLDNDMRRRMIDYYAPEVDRLGKIVGRDLTHWLRGTKE